MGLVKMDQRKAFILYEHGYDHRPFGSAFIRLLRPLSYPLVAQKYEISFGTRYDGQPVDAVILDRLWRPDVSPALIDELIRQIRAVGAKLIYSLDDNFLDLYAKKQETLLKERVWIVERLLSQADMVWVTTQRLRNRYLSYQPNIVVLPHALDECLLVNKNSSAPPFSRPVTIGYMGTFTHDRDMQLVLPALAEVKRKYSEKVQFEVIGAATQKEVLDPLRKIGACFQQPHPEEAEYPLFMLWFTGRVHWDIALAPLTRSPFADCKSDIKFLDYTAIGAAGIYSRVPAYEKTIRNGENGLLAENDPHAWLDAVETLITQPDLRHSILKESTIELHQKRILAVAWKQWVDALENTLNSKAHG
jgi:glycosyltransferase involved in cell wall biosynthesis